MRLTEFEGKQIFSKYKIKIPKGFLISNPKEIVKNLDFNNFNEYSVKAQILLGKRGKLGAIQFADKSNLSQVAKSLFNKKFEGFDVNKLLIEEKISLDKQFYLGITLSRKDDSYILVFSEQGGADIEEISKSSPESIKKLAILKPQRKDLIRFFPNSKFKDKLIDTAMKLFKIVYDYDAVLVEINPLINIKNHLVALDSKIIIDDNALFRHQDIAKEKEMQLSRIEREAFHLGVSFVQLSGNIAVISNGAGLVMATLDLIDYYGGKPANFLDIGAGAGMKEIFEGLKMLLEEKPKGILINIFAGMTRCDEIANGIIKFRKQYKIKIPFVVRMIGTNEEDAKLMLKKENIEMLDSMEECVKKIVKEIH